MPPPSMASTPSTSLHLPRAQIDTAFLTVRQEVHPDEFDELRELVQWLDVRTITFGAIGYLRLLEAEVPDVLVADPAAKTAQRLTLPSARSEEEQLIPDPWS
ncbi:hypothetical protein [Streptomyces hesseae]|uniref:Uncharacterized protein n=1 Tax=Streptomyces hesseae TaxID=3075519 RepID=A0ABU2SYD3_9ACTN|nr:hypothetical protein [Streptomyces sp. DSM 40473]MDT0453738.1 hypothetical protein [Streptomyces sp. DSM 40473]